MIGLDLETLECAPYRALLAEALPSGARCAISDPAGRVVHSDPEFPVEMAARLLGAAEQRRGGLAGLKLLRLRAAGEAFCVAPLRGGNDEILGYLWVAAPGERLPAAVGARMSAVAVVLARHLELDAELNELATELAERYEELNLVYQTEDQVRFFAEGRDALAELVGNCRAYLDVRAVALLMPDKGIEILNVDEEGGGADGRLIDALMAAVYPRLAAEGEALIINEPGSDELGRLLGETAGRILAAPVCDAKGAVTGMLALLNDARQPRFSNSDKNLLGVMARKAAKIVQVNYDSLTGFVNREGFEFVAAQELRESRQQGREDSVLHIDIDQLRLINDTASNEAGDALLQAVAAELRRGVRDSDVLGRLGGDEFGILLRRCPLRRAEQIANKLRESVVDLVVPWKGRALATTVSIGVVPLDDEAESAATALAAAELACEAAKELGKNRVHCYAHSDTGLIKRHHEMEAVGKIQSALEHDLFELHAQVIEPLAVERAGLHLEVLLRMRGNGDAPLAPSAFLPAAERYHLMPQVDRWVVARSLEFLRENDSLVERLDAIAINLSGQSLNEPAFIEFLEEQLSGSVLPLSKVVFEITETAAVADLDHASEFMRGLKTRGCRFALDDFGAGLSSFGYLRSLPVDYLKIDGSIVRGVAEDPIAAAMVAAVQEIARVMGLRTVAEFVENEAIRAKLRELGVGYVQGYAIGKPRPLASFVPAARAAAVAGQ